MRIEPVPPAAESLDAYEQLGGSFKRAVAATRRLRGRETHHPDDLSYAQYSLLFGLAGGGELSSRELADAAELSPATVTQMLETLEAAGLVERSRSADDKRIVFTSLTERGRILIEERRARHEARWRAALSEFSEDELRTAAAVMDRIGRLFGEIADE